MKVEVVKEIRFAVVMYGGVSLAIYINGVAQELLRMVRATAVNEETDEFLFDEEKDNFDESEKNYRALAYLLGNQDLMVEFSAKLKKNRDWKNLRSELNERVNSQNSVKIVRFVVDIMSGSSAGGINAIYLSKALVSGQDIDSLQKLWIDEGDFSLLLNDKKSVLGTNLTLSETPSSLFNSQRMYLKLLEAFDEKKEKNNSATNKICPMIDEVDLFVTLTDFWGLPIPVRLFDKIIYERNHRRRLHFKYRGGGINDFKKENYPFLAYAARCTSSFPVAFEPMKLSDTIDVLKNLEGNQKLGENWKKYFPQERIRLNEKRIDWKNRVFVDGGTLDNKPFGYAIEALAQKQANVLIDRKLIYIEPKPDLDGGNQRTDWIHRPNVVKNTINIVTALPGYETIREDLHQVLERNRLIEKVNFIVSNAEKDEYRLLDLIKNDLHEVVRDNQLLAAPRENKEWADLTIAEIARYKGQAIYPYYRLRMSALTDDLAKLSTRRAGFDDDSDYYLAIRSLVRAWRLQNYNKDEDVQSRNPIPRFLYDFDFNYRLRRLRFVLQEADKLLSALNKISSKKESFVDLSSEDFKNDKFFGDFKIRYDLTVKLKGDTTFQNVLQQPEASRILRQKFALIEDELFDTQADSPIVTIFKAQKDELEPLLRNVKKDINRHLKELSARQQIIETRSIDSEMTDKSRELNIHFSSVAKKLTHQHLSELLGETSVSNMINEYDLESSSKIGRKFLDENPKIKEEIEKIANTLQQIYNGDSANNVDENKSIFGKVRQAKNILHQSPQSITPLENAIRSYLYHFYENFDNYDQIIFPITYETPIGEGDIVEIARVSPADAVNLIDEEKEKEADQRKKLAGDTFFSFSAFFNGTWRKNDIMWGRLDAVERLTELVVSDSDLIEPKEFRKIFTTAAQREILEKNRELLLNENNKKEIDIDLVEFVRRDYQVNRIIQEDSIMKTTARTFGIIAKVLESPVEDTSKEGTLKFEQANKYLRRFAKFIKPFAQMTEASTYNLFSRKLFSLLIAPFRMEWLTVLYFLLILLLSGIWIIISSSFLADVVVLEKFLTNATNRLILGVIFVAFFFYLIFFSLMYLLKTYIFRKLAKEIIG